MNLMDQPLVLLSIVAVFLGGLIYVRNLNEKALALLSAEEKGMWIDGMRQSRKYMFYGVITLVAVYMAVVILGGNSQWYASWESYILIAYFALLVLSMLWTHYKSMQFLTKNGFSEEVISLLRRSFWIKAMAYLFPLAIMWLTVRV